MSKTDDRSDALALFLAWVNSAPTRRCTCRGACPEGLALLGCLRSRLPRRAARGRSLSRCLASYCQDQGIVLDCEPDVAIAAIFDDLLLTTAGARLLRCPACGAWFIRDEVRQRACSPACAESQTRDRRRAYMRSWRQRPEVKLRAK
jgi:hypothetical protein